MSLYPTCWHLCWKEVSLAPCKTLESSLGQPKLPRRHLSQPSPHISVWQYDINPTDVRARPISVSLLFFFFNQHRSGTERPAFCFAFFLVETTWHRRLVSCWSRTWDLRSSEKCGQEPFPRKVRTACKWTGCEMKTMLKKTSFSRSHTVFPLTSRATAESHDSCFSKLLLCVCVCFNSSH